MRSAEPSKKTLWTLRLGKERREGKGGVLVLGSYVVLFSNFVSLNRVNFGPFFEPR